MAYDLQRASLWKRIAAGMFDAILTAMAAVGLAVLLSLILNYDSYSQTLDAAYADYEAEYGIRFSITSEEYEALSREDRQRYDDAYQALTADEHVLRAYNMSFNLMLVITTGAIFLAVLAMEFFLPLYLGSGRTLGKKIFGLCLMRTDGVAVNKLQLFTRTILGKFTIEIMVPLCILFMIFWGIWDVTGTFVLLGLLLAQILIPALTSTNSLIHDLLAGTVVVDYTSQMIFKTTEDLIAYQKRVAAERAARQTY